VHCWLALLLYPPWLALRWRWLALLLYPPWLALRWRWLALLLLPPGRMQVDAIKHCRRRRNYSSNSIITWRCTTAVVARQR